MWRDEGFTCHGSMQHVALEIVQTLDRTHSRKLSLIIFNLELKEGQQDWVLGESSAFASSLEPGFFLE